MGIVERAFKRLFPPGRAWHLPGTLGLLIEGFAMSLERARTFIRGILAESVPWTATAMLPEWHAALGQRYDSTQTVAYQQRTLDAIQTAIGATTLNELSEQLHKELASVNIGEISASPEAAVDECGVAECGADEFATDPFTYELSGEVEDDVEAARCAAILAHYAPLHLTPDSILTVLSADESSEAGADECMLAVAEGYDGVYIAPVFNTPATLHGHAQPGALLYCMPGEVIGGPTPAVTYQWQLNTVDIPGETGQSYAMPLAPVVGDSYTCEVTATNVAGSASSTTGASVTAAELPSISGVLITLRSTGVLEVVSVTYEAGYPAPSLTYQWRDGGVDVPGETGQSFAPAVAGNYSCEVTATNLAGAAVRESSAIAVTVPVVSSVVIAMVATMLSVTSVVVTGNPAPTLSYQWKIGGAAIPGATTDSYAPAVMGSYTCEVTATNVLGTDSLESAAIAITAATLSNDIVIDRIIVGGSRRLTIVSGGTPGGTPAGTLTFQWFIDGLPDPGQTQSWCYWRFAPGTYFVRVMSANAFGGDVHDSNSLVNPW